MRPRHPGEPCGGGVREGDPPVRGEGDDAVGQELEEALVAGLGRAQRALGLLLGRDVAREGDDERRPGVTQEREPRLDGERRPVPAAVAGAERRDASLLHERDHPGEPRVVEPLHEGEHVLADELAAAVAEAPVRLLVRVEHERARVAEEHRVRRAAEQLGDLAWGYGDDAFVALPGGLGTLEELFEIWTWGMLGLHRKPYGLLDVDGYYQPLITFLDHARDEGFVRPSQRDRLVVDTDAERLLAALARAAGERSPSTATAS